MAIVAIVKLRFMRTDSHPVFFLFCQRLFLLAAGGLWLMLSGCATPDARTHGSLPLYTDPADIQSLFDQRPAPPAADAWAPATLIQLALEAAPSIREREMDVRRIIAQAEKARPIRAPEVRLGVQRAKEDAGDGTYVWEGSSESDWTAGVRLFPPNPWEVAAKARLVDARIHGAFARLSQERQRISEQTALAIAEGLYRQQEVQLLEKLHQTAREYLRQTGRRPLQDQTDALRRTLAIQTRMLKARQQWNELNARLAQLTGRPVSLETRPSHWDWLPQPTPEALTPLLDDAHLRRADIALAYWKLCELMAEQRETQAQRLPWLQHVGASYEVDGSRTKNQDEWELQTAISLPVFDWLSPGASASFRAILESAADHLEITRDAARADIHQRIQQAVESEKTLKRFETIQSNVIRALAENRELLQQNQLLKPDKAIQIGEEIVDATLSLHALRLAHLKSQIHLWSALGAPAIEPE